MGERDSQKEREQLARSLRASGASWVEVAAALRARYRCNARVALRYAHGWTQRQATDEWNRCWPDELKTFKTFSYWEQWPSGTGHAPSFNNLAKLAELYECAVSDLLSDLPDFSHRDTAAGPSLRAAVERTLATVPGTDQDDWQEWGVLSPLIVPRDAAPLVRRLEEVQFSELVQVIVMWMQQLNPAVSRRVLLSKHGSPGASPTCAAC